MALFMSARQAEQPQPGTPPLTDHQLHVAILFQPDSMPPSWLNPSKKSPVPMQKNRHLAGFLIQL
jgi:hypothetical protein